MPQTSKEVAKLSHAIEGVYGLRRPPATTHQLLVNSIVFFCAPRANIRILFVALQRSAIRSTLRASGRAPLRASRSVIHGTSMKFGAAFPSALRRCYSTGSTIQEEIANQIKQAKVVIYMKVCLCSFTEWYYR
jgi:hypothetical protein